MTLHSPRHTHASLLIEQGTHVKVLSERLGHASVAFTMDTYAHLLRGLQQQAADAIDRSLASG
ncbi:MAG: tyrosine-type recombinase/integrase [Chloroflexi bacterium]|nr:tyrosine-type recombinase/integrase [Chloroflexota bacterium]MDA1282406.1 tyrosine-type recombinase/integrase [Chloroflexota bacterium]